MLAMQKYAMRTTSGIPGAPAVIASKSVSKVSISYDPSLSAMEGGGPWNLTFYGQQYLWYVQLVGTGGFEVLSYGYGEAMVGVVNTWQVGVQRAFGS